MHGSRFKQAVVALAGIACFCGYLVTACTRVEPKADTAPMPHPSAMLLSRSLPAGTHAPGAPVTAPIPAAATKPTPPRASAPSTPLPYRVVWAVVTAYCPCRKCCGRHANGWTSTHTSAWLRGIAADPTAIPYGTRIYVEGYGFAKVDDTGGAMRHTWRRTGMIHVDVRMTYHYQARRWGRKIMRIRIYDR